MNDTHSVSTVNKVIGEDVAPIKPKKRRKPINKEEISGTLYASIPLLGFLIFGVIPLCMAFAMAFLKMSGFGFQGAKPAGWDNFKYVLTDELFWESIVNTCVLGSSTFICQILALLVAYLLSKDIRGRKAFRMIYFIPYVCSGVAIVLMWKYIFNPHFGILNQMLGRTGDNIINWLNDSRYYSWVVIFISVWSGMGYPIVLYTAALTNVNRSTVEAATIDGAGPFRVFWNVVFPAISPTSFFLLVTGVIGALQSFATSNVLSSGTTNANGPNNDGLTIVFYLYRKIFDYDGQMGYASASSWILSLIILGVTIINFVGSKKWVSYDQ